MGWEREMRKRKQGDSGVPGTRVPRPDFGKPQPVLTHSTESTEDTLVPRGCRPKGLTCAANDHSDLWKQASARAFLRKGNGVP